MLACHAPTRAFVCVCVVSQLTNLYKDLVIQPTYQAANTVQLATYLPLTVAAITMAAAVVRHTLYLDAERELTPPRCTAQALFVQL